MAKRAVRAVGTVPTGLSLLCRTSAVRRHEQGVTTREMPTDATSLSPSEGGWSDIRLSLSLNERRVCVPRSLACV